jgi:hypothetical protein
MIRHQAQPQHIDRHDPLAGLKEKFHEGGVVLGLMEDFHPAVAAIEHVIDTPALDGPRCSWHRQKLAERAENVNIMNVPFSCLSPFPV